MKSWRDCRAYKQNAGSCHQQQRMERALILLNGTTLSIEEIAAMLGYSNHSNFYKAFKEYYGTTPKDYLPEK